jgi:hypothetical protein
MTSLNLYTIESNGFNITKENIARLALSNPGETFSNCSNNNIIPMNSPSFWTEVLDIEGNRVVVSFSMYGTFECQCAYNQIKPFLSTETIEQFVENFNLIQKGYPPQMNYILGTPVLSPIISVWIKKEDDIETDVESDDDDSFFF